MKFESKTIWIIDHYASEPAYGGISRHYDFAMELGRRGYRVVVVASGFSHYTHRYLSPQKVMVGKPAPRVCFIYLKTCKYEENNGLGRAENMVSFLVQVLRYEPGIAARFGKPDVVMGCSVHPLAWVAANRIAGKYHVRFVAEVRDFWPQIWVDSGVKEPRDFMVRFFAWLEKWAFQHAGRIIYSQYHGDRYICGKLGFPRGKAYRIGQVMDCVRYDQNRQKEVLLPTEMIEFLAEGFICAFSGYYVEYNGDFTMLEALRILKKKGLPVKMVFAGHGQEKGRMLQYVKENGLDNVLIWGRLDREAVPAFVSRCDVCIAQAGHKGRPDAYQYGVSMLKLNEYLYSGACTLFGFCFADNEVVESGGGIQFEPYNAADLAEKIETVYRMADKERKAYGKRARDYYRKYHSVEVLTDTLVEALFL